MQWDLVGSSLGDLPKELGSSLGREGRSPGRRPEDLPQDCQRLLEYTGGVLQKKIIGGSRKACPDLGIGPSSDDEVGSCRKFARRFDEGIGKLAGNMKGDRQEKDMRTCRKNSGCCRIMRDSVES
ncbi:hypothetical protein BHM03_00041381 [Ensete ventricosum]|nr:hypothetical protein BHM03_00041381 [Ensete ventricosum]